LKKWKVYQVEVTSICNMKCPFCARTEQWAHREHGFMKMDLLDRIDWGDTEYTELQMAGEPTLHTELTQIVEHVKKLGIKVGLSTNATKERDLSNVDIITNTVDSFRSKTLAKEYPTQVFTQHLGEDHPYEDTTHKKPCFSEKVFKCRTPFEYVSIHWDGDVVPCCKCFGKQHVFGNLYDQTMEEIWNSKKRADFLHQLSVKEKHPYICRYCGVTNPHEIHQKLLKWKESQDAG